GRADVEPREALAPGPEPRAGAERHAAVLEERGGRIVAQDALAAVDPGEEAGLGRRVTRAGQLALEQRGEAPPVDVEVPVQRVEPRAAPLERGDRGKHAEVAGVERQARRQLRRELRTGVGARDDDGSLEPGDVPR